MCGNTGLNALVEGNRIQDNGRNGVFSEISSVITVRNNAIRRNGGTGVFISTSRAVSQLDPVPSLDGLKSWNEWQALGQDVTVSISQ